ncbi:helix-turn-helix transcriptional regulator [Streptomyces sp. NPDC059649]|uniref:helix-turn-helix transcriptional regulator n=1 Tax=Streptomyces sp. NPDC059649 TaxID=3346895 RepID=UPI0036912DCB
MSTSRPMLTQREAATACGVSRSTIRRRREAGELPGAVQDPERGWLIPIEALLAAGLRPNAPAPAADAEAPETAGPSLAGAPALVGEEAAELRAELVRLKHEHALQLAEERHARELAQAEKMHLERQLAERGEHIESLQQALRALAPAPERAAIPPPATPAAAPTVPGQNAAGHEETVARRKWWRRG